MSLRSRSLRSRLVRWSLGSLGSVSLLAAPASAVNITWIGGNTQWDDGGTTASWNPADEPDSNDAAIFNTNNLVTVGTDNVINGLTMSASSELQLNGHALTVDGATTLSGGGTRLDLSGALSALNGADVTINNGATIFLDGGTIQSTVAGAANSTVTINAGGTLSGNGELSMTDTIAALTTLINNNGTISATNPSAVILLPPAAATLHISATDADARFDLDGSLEGGFVNVTRNQTLDIDVQLSDIFNGTLTMTQEAKLDVSTSWILGAGAAVNIDNGAVGGLGGAPAGKATIAGSSFSQNSGAITVVDNDGTLQFDAALTINGGTFVNNGLVIFNSTTVLGAAAGMTLPTTSSSFTVAANRNVTINQNNFNLDGGGAATNVITVESNGELTVNTTDYDPDAATNAFDGTVNLHNGTISINTSDAEFVMNGVINASADGVSQSLWTGEAIDIGDDLGALDADLNVTGSQPTQFGAQVDFNADADVNVSAGATLHFLLGVNFNSVNGGNNAEFTGAGEMIFSDAVNINETTTLNMLSGTVDLDGADSIGDTINIDAPLTINAELVRSFGKNNGGGGTNLLDVNNNVGTGVLTVNLDDPAAEWTINPQGVVNLVNDNTEGTLLAGSDVQMNGTVNVTGDVRTTARLDLAGVVNIGTAGQPLRLAGGNNADDPNTIAGGTITGTGLLGADAGKELRGFGTINTGIDFDGNAKLRADNGTLTINGAIVDADQVGTADADGTFHVTNAWNNNVTTGVQLNGGVLSGGTITNDVVAGISGHGLVTARVINNTQLFASIGDTLIFETAGNDNDWDGTTNTGEIEAVSGNIELRDVGPAFGFTGSVTATNAHTAMTNGFALDFNPGSTLTLASGGRYQSTASTDLSGAVTIGAGGATIEVQNNNFLTFETGSATTLGSNLQLKNNNIIVEAGATFSGAGAIVIPDGSNVVVENMGNVGVLLDMQGGFRPGNSEGIGRVDLLDFQQASTSELFVELTGTPLNAFDRLVASGDVIVDGFLSIDIDGGFVPALGNTFNIITGNTVSGVFDTVDVSGMPAGLAFHLNYLGNAVQLQVVNKPIFSADFDDDGDVDSTDLAIWKGAFNLNQLGDANGDNKTDGSDFLLWQRQFGSVPAVAVGTPAAAAVPEPTAFALLAFVAAGIAAARRRELANLL